MSISANYRFIDSHYHASPDLYMRRLNALDAGRVYQGLQGAVVLKSHLGSTGIQATLAQSQGLPVLPSLVLNAIAGGINYRVIMQALADYQPMIKGNMIVDFPTITGRPYQTKLARQCSSAIASEHAFTSEILFNDRGCLRQEAIDILKMASDYPIVLSSGHASKAEVYALIEACAKYQVPALLLNQPANPLTGLNATELLEIADQDFVWIEQTFLTYALGHQHRQDFFRVLNEVPRLIYSSDLGQTSQIDVPSWVSASAQLFAEAELPIARQDEIWRVNPATLLGIMPFPGIK